MELLKLNRNHPLILGTNNENLPRVISIIGEALSREAVDKESDCYPRMLNIVRQLQVSTVTMPACKVQRVTLWTVSV